MNSKGFATRLKSQLTGAELEEILIMEIETYTRIAKKHRVWLAAPKSKFRSHYHIIASEVKVIEAKVRALKSDLGDLRNSNIINHLTQQ